MTIRYYVTRGGTKPGTRKLGYWAPCLKRRSKITGAIEPTLMAQLGFGLVNCGDDGPKAWAIAESWNAKWDQTYADYLAGRVTVAEPGQKADRLYPPGSVGECYARYRKTSAWAVKKPRTKEDWERAWRYIDPVFGDVDPETIAFEDLDLWYGGDPLNPAVKGLLGTIGVREAYRAMKIWRALWNVMRSLKRASGDRYVTGDDPSLSIRRQTPKPRQATWREGEAVRLVKRAWRMGYRGLAAALATAWDTMLSPVDVRKLTTAQMTSAGLGAIFEVQRTKTGRDAVGTLGRRSTRLLRAYIDGLPFDLHPETPIFHTRGGQPGPKGGRPRPPAPYTKDTLGADFRIVREVEFPGDQRMIMDFRRSGALEATAGGVDHAALASKMANSIDSNRELQKTYIPQSAAVVQLADEARARGRERLRKNGK